MTTRPNRTEWDISRLASERRAYLDGDLSFERIAEQVLTGTEILRSRIEPFREPALGEEDGRQIVFLVRVGNEATDRLFNAPDGMRGRYWQSPDHGYDATKRLMVGLMRPLLRHAMSHPPTSPEGCAPMSREDIQASLECVSAKIWPRELDDGGRELFRVDRLHVLRWDTNDRNGRWRTSPTTDEWEIKGGIIGSALTEYIPALKRRRSCQIHELGFS